VTWLHRRVETYRLPIVTLKELKYRRCDIAGRSIRIDSEIGAGVEALSLFKQGLQCLGLTPEWPPIASLTDASLELKQGNVQLNPQRRGGEQIAAVRVDYTAAAERHHPVRAADRLAKEAGFCSSKLGFSWTCKDRWHRHREGGLYLGIEVHKGPPEQAR